MDIGALFDIDFGEHVECHPIILSHEFLGIFVALKFLIRELKEPKNMDF